MVHRKGATNKDSLAQNVESENGRTVLATIGGAPSKVVARNADDEYRHIDRRHEGNDLSSAPQRLSLKS